ncbi:MAG: helix-turn-helix domain-containing protein [Actinomycetota bacterium]|nr:helix-turn-helix domain-containing protein [Actinomycetota bacterium]
MTDARPLLAVLDELERRRRRDFEQVRYWLIRATSGHDGSTPAGALDAVHTRPVTLLLSLEDAADVLNVSPSTVKRLVRAGELPAVKVARTTRVRRSDLDAYVAALVPSGPGAPA